MMGKRYSEVTKIVSRSVSNAFLGEKKITLCIIIGSKFNHGRKQVLVISLIISFEPFILLVIGGKFQC